MSQQGFARLIADYCHRVGLAGGAEKVLRGAPLKVDEVLIAVDWKQDRMPALGFVHADLGCMDKEHAPSVCVRLLSANMWLHAATGQSVSVSPASGRILLSAHFSLKRTDAAALEQLLTSLAKTAQALKQQCMQIAEAAPSRQGSAGDRGA